ncbi:unnamed protein product [Haemonchus placei]|uniref:RING-type domain-containing protein n=1 Tax=Haemonchus placei TaxID=6290 RepID=A0A0N4W605_HAEPC|nr:unnamed protein product [Haemonchus placei]
MTEKVDDADSKTEEKDSEQCEEVVEEGDGAHFVSHGGDPRSLDLNRCLLLSNLPSVFLNDPFDEFSNTMLDWIAQDFKVARDAMEKIVRIPKLQADAENQHIGGRRFSQTAFIVSDVRFATSRRIRQSAIVDRVWVADLALRAIISFKSRVHKHRVFAQKSLAAESSIKLDVIDSIPREFVEVEDDLEMADEVDGDEELAEEHDESNEQDEPKPKVTKTDGEAVSSSAEEPAAEGDKEQNGVENGEETAKPKKKEYVDEDLEAPFEISWEGAPEFQWKLCPTPADTRRLILENVFWSDLQNVFIYRVMLKAETVDINFPMRFNIEGSKQMYGKVTMTFQWSMQIMHEAMRHLIYVRCPLGRRIKIFLPQTTSAMKLKEEFEGKLGRTIEPTRRMHQLIVKVLPENYELTLEAAKEMFAPLEPVEVENVKDDADQPCAIVTMASVEDTIKAHSSTYFVTIKVDDKDTKCHVFLRGVEAHFGSLLTRWDKKRNENSKKSSKRPAVSAKRPAGDKAASGSAKKPRGSSIRGTRGSGRGSSRAARSFGGRGRGRVDPYYGDVFGSRYEAEARMRQEIELQQRMIREQEMMAAKLREQERFGYGGRPYGGSAFSYGRSSYGGGYE